MLFRLLALGTALWMTGVAIVVLDALPPRNGSEGRTCAGCAVASRARRVGWTLLTLGILAVVADGVLGCLDLISAARTTAVLKR
ncbi:hypothetical protein DMH15_01075 [Streptomyces sp. WAC 06725]|uniref:hypothetical protein n=1 Tax=Streptomyces sp. WAC 06725 TaxID=2203209 RepID=UPI000F73E44D|nr:hypothetical protein [Streptomyces sp. WAC 06725]RSO50546.1 hypothetical protein DMH15_01075 [Streptomyces sp. WAC 06725]